MDGISNIYILHSEQNTDVVSLILERLRPIVENQEVTIWYDDPIQEERSWTPKEAARLHETDFFILLLSNAFMYSEFVQQVEFKTVIDRYKEGKSTVIPVILEDCPWDVEFNSDEYDFSFKELAVIPTDGRPIKLATNPGQYYDQVADTVKKALGLFTDESESLSDVGQEALSTVEKEQLAMHFSEEPQAAIENPEIVTTEEIEAKITQETDQKQRELETRQNAEAVKRQQEEAKKEALEEQRMREEVAAEEAHQNEIAMAERIEAQEQRSSQFADRGMNIGQEVAMKGRGRRWVLIGLLIAVLGIIGIWILSTSSDDTKKKPSVAIPAENPSKPTEGTSTSESKTDDVSIDDALSPVLNLQLGDRHEGGTIFHLDASGERGKIAHTQDAGPMSWKRAMAIQEQLGTGWRLPTLEELKQMYRTIGPGSTNSGQFSPKLYWSATPYETYQARLLQFRDGNSSYHYNKEVESRQFLVRAVRDF